MSTQTALADVPIKRIEASSEFSFEPERLYRMPLELYHAIAEHGLLTPRDKVVLLDGLLVKKMTRGAPHVTATQRLINALIDLANEGWYARKEDPIILADGPDGHDSEPEPDVAVVRGRLEDYETRHPRGADVLLVAEVSSSSVNEDRKGMARYAHAAIPVAWLVNLLDRNVEVYTSPTGPAESAHYFVMTVYGPDDQIPVMIDGREVGRLVVKDILP